MVSEAGEAASELEQMAASARSVWINTSRVTNGMIGLAENNTSVAMEALTMADPDDVLCRVLLAETYKKMGNSAEFDALRTDVLTTAGSTSSMRVRRSHTCEPRSCNPP